MAKTRAASPSPKPWSGSRKPTRRSWCWTRSPTPAWWTGPRGISRRSGRSRAGCRGRRVPCSAGHVFREPAYGLGGGVMSILCHTIHVAFRFAKGRSFAERKTTLPAGEWCGSRASHSDFGLRGFFSAHFGSRPFTNCIASVIQVWRSVFVASPSGAMMTQPFMGFPVMSIGPTCG